MNKHEITEKKNNVLNSLLSKPKEKMKDYYRKNKFNIILICIEIFLVAVFMFFLFDDPIDNSKDKSTDLDTSLQNMIKISELSTFETVYKGVTTVYNEKKPKEIDYYVSYEATVTAGIDFKKVDVSVDDDKGTVTISLPNIIIHEPEFTGKELEYMFINKKADKSGISADAYEFCKEDAINETKDNGAITKLAKQNSENIITALAMPFINHLDKDYIISFEWGNR